MMLPMVEPGAVGVRRVSERAVVGILAGVQFVNILDFMIVSPLGPDFSTSIGIRESDLGYVVGSYTASACVSGLAGSLVLDRFDRRSALAVALLGLVIGTAACGFATDLWTLVLARVIAGFFGGPATSLAYAILADVVPNERRGRAVSLLMGAFSAAAVLGVPAGLELARLGSWRTAFFAVAALGLVFTIAGTVALPTLRGHLTHAAGYVQTSLRDLLARPLVRRSYLMTATALMAGFILIPNMSAYTQRNLGYPREAIGGLYGAGGVASLLAMLVVGRLVDRFGSTLIATIGTVSIVVVVWFGFVAYTPAFPVLALFVLFMLAMTVRNVAYNTLTTKVPEPAERARFMSIQSAVGHAASAAGAMAGPWLLSTLPGGRLAGIETVAYISIGLSLVLPGLMWIVERRVRTRSHEAAPAATTALAEHAVALRTPPPGH